MHFLLHLTAAATLARQRRSNVRGRYSRLAEEEEGVRATQMEAMVGLDIMGAAVAARRKVLCLAEMEG